MSILSCVNLSDDLSINSQRIMNFYKQNPRVSFEEVNIQIINIFESMGIENIPPNVQNIDNTQSQLSQFKNDLIKEVRLLTNSNPEDIHILLEKTHNSIIDKTAFLLNNILPKTNQQLSSQIIDSITNMDTELQQNYEDICKDNNRMKEFINNFDLKLSMLIQNQQQPLLSSINILEERVSNHISSIKSDIRKQPEVISEQFAEIVATKIIDKSNMRPLSPCCNMQSVITNLYTSCELLKHKNMSDSFVLRRKYKPVICLKTSDSEENIPMNTSEELIMSIDDERCHGILMSQNSGISNKDHFEIELHNNYIIVYLHKMNYDETILKTAVDIIDHLSSKLNFLKSNIHNKELAISKDIMDSINNEYHMFISQKLAVVDVLKENQKRIFSQLDELKMPSLDKYLSQHYLVPVAKPGIKRELCNSYNANNLKALAAHKRGCIRKNRTATM